MAIWVPSPPAAPVRLSMTMFWPRTSPSFLATMRPTTFELATRSTSASTRSAIEATAPLNVTYRGNVGHTPWIGVLPSVPGSHALTIENPASGARIVGALVHELRRRGGGLGVAAICSGGGQGDAIVLDVLPEIDYAPGGDAAAALTELTQQRKARAPGKTSSALADSSSGPTAIRR